MIAHDLIPFPGARISLTSIHAITADPEEADVVYVDYGHGSRVGFEGDIAAVMKIIDDYCAGQRVGA